MPSNHVPISHACRKLDFIIILISVMNKCTLQTEKKNYPLLFFLKICFPCIYTKLILKKALYDVISWHPCRLLWSASAFWRLSVDSVTGKPWMIFHWSPETWLVNCRVDQVRNQRFINIKHILNSFCIVQARIIHEQNQ